MPQNTHFEYGNTLYGPSLAYWAKRCLKALPRDHHWLISSSSSGCALASAMVALAPARARNYDAVYRFRPDEINHGYIYPVNQRRGHNGKFIQGVDNPLDIADPVFVDDLIDCGRTFNRVQRLLRKLNANSIELAIVCHERANIHSSFFAKHPNLKVVQA